MQRYFAAARAAYPQRDDAALTEVAQNVCAKLRADPSAHDVIGDLAGQLGSQPVAKHLVDAAANAYCPTATATR